MQNWDAQMLKKIKGRSQKTSVPCLGALWAVQTRASVSHLAFRERKRFSDRRQQRERLVVGWLRSLTSACCELAASQEAQWSLFVLTCDTHENNSYENSKELLNMVDDWSDVRSPTTGEDPFNGQTFAQTMFYTNLQPGSWIEQDYINVVEEKPDNRETSSQANHLSLKVAA